MGRNAGTRVKRAVFLDRDGVLNRNVFNPATGEFESPLTPEQFDILPGVMPALQLLQDAGYLLCLVSNQPNYAKGKASMPMLHAIHRKLETALRDEEISFTAFYYCFHHPEFTGACLCRKPSPYFLFQARDEFAVSLSDSWMIGDRGSDVACGRNAGVKTIQITDSCLSEPRADYDAADLWSAAQMVLG
jgi:D-glycero-D-manno-heptose 1,7-bisphosphate phosphatase